MGVDITPDWYGCDLPETWEIQPPRRLKSTVMAHTYRRRRSPW